MDISKALRNMRSAMGSIFGPLMHPSALSPSERLLVGVVATVVLISGLHAGTRLYNSSLVSIPAPGGTLVEGLVGSPRFLNPVLATSASDQDLTALIYAGLMHRNEAGELAPWLAEQMTVSQDGLTYDFTLRANAMFHDNSPITADDVIFTIERLQDPLVKSPLFSDWEGVTAEKISEREVRFVLATPYAPFLSNTTVGILPKRLWEQATPDEMPFSTLNTQPIGSGPFQVTRVDRDRSGIPMRYTLERFKKFAPGESLLARMVFVVFRNEEARLEALARGDIQAAGGVSASRIPTLEEKGLQATRAPLPRVFAVFFNQNTNQVFADTSVRAALGRVIPKEIMIEEIFHGYASVLTGPVPPGIPLPVSAEATTTTNTAATSQDSASAADARMRDAEEIMNIGGWQRGQDGVWEKGGERLAFSLATANLPELAESAEFMVRSWREFGAEVKLETFDSTDLTRDVIRPRRYEALFFGIALGRELDLYPFWHSSQRNDPGLNVALYTNITADAALEKLRVERNPEAQAELLTTFLREVRVDVPAAFVFSPEYLYVHPKALTGLSLEGLEVGKDRFQQVTRWYMEEDYVWPFVRSWLMR